jgi:hypothetical protein
MSDEMSSKPMGMLLHDPTLRDEQKEYLHVNYPLQLRPSQGMTTWTVPFGAAGGLVALLVPGRGAAGTDAVSTSFSTVLE